MKWEYNTVYRPGCANPDSIVMLEKMGLDQWELVCVIPRNSSGGYLEGHTFYFKRPITDPVGGYG